MNHLKHPLKHFLRNFSLLQNFPSSVHMCSGSSLSEPYTVINGDGKTPSEQAELAGLELLYKNYILLLISCKINE